MKIHEIIACCESFPGVTSDFPFGPAPLCMRVGGRIFAQILPNGAPGALRILLEDKTIPRECVAPMVTLRCTPENADFLRREYPGVIVRPYHCPTAQQPYSNTVLLHTPPPEDVLRSMIRHAYDTVFHKLTKKAQREIQAAGNK